MRNYLHFAQENKVAFDIGNVLFHFDLNPLLDLLINLNIVDDSKTAYEFMGGSFQHSQEIGLYNIRQSFYQLNQKFSDKILDDIYDRWIKTFTPSLPMIDLVEELIGNGYRVALLSNIGPDHAMAVRNKCKIFEACIQHFSCEVGARKPTRLFFQSFLSQYGWSDITKYFDDRKENIAMGSEYYNAILFDINNYTSDEEAAKAMRSYILEG